MTTRSTPLFQSIESPSNNSQQPQPQPQQSHKQIADAIASESAESTDSTLLKLQSEEIQKLLKVVELYLAGGKQQREVSAISAGVYDHQLMV